jgi:hypothetical protein
MLHWRLRTACQSRYIPFMQYVCDAPGGRTWFSMEKQAEADAESELMRHAVAKHFCRAVEAARKSYRPRDGLASFERDIGLKDHIAHNTPIFLTLRDGEGNALATAMLSRDVVNGAPRRAIIVGPENADPWPEHADAIASLGKHYGVRLNRDASYPYA